MTESPLLFVDVDGVLNPFPELPDGYEEHHLFPKDDEPVRLSPTHGPWLAELAAVFQLVWATGWGDEANRLLCPFFGLRSLEAIELPPVPFEPQEKVPVIASFAGDRAVAWLDDVVTPEALDWAASRTAPTLLVHVDSRVGLQRANIDRLLSWAAGL